ncbi:MAG: carbohydrate kinase family protein, partial [Candidatus Hermodarchaeota archaeon]
KDKGGMVFAAPSMSIIKNAPSWAKILISNSDVVSINLEEAQEFTGESKKTLMIKTFLDMGIKLISITDGPNGSIISDGKTIITSGVYSAGKVEDTTGAGDAFLTGILISQLNNFSLEKTSKMATAMSFLECKEVGVREGLPNSLAELETFVNDNTIKQVISEIV